MRHITLAFLIFGPVAAHAVGFDDPEPPKPSETTTECQDGMVWDLATETCMAPEESSNSDQALLNDARELAYAGQYEAVIRVLNSMENSETTMALTYYGFAHRKAGRTDLGQQFYNAALSADPDNHLARSYMGQGYVEAGQLDLAVMQLEEIRLRGGQGGWAEQALQRSIASGTGYGY